MSFKVIKGTFHVVGYSPDGDSVRFKAFDPEKWTLLGGAKVRLNAKGHAQLRIEAIDTLETHYKAEHQPRQFASEAMIQLFRLLGIKDLVWQPSGLRVKSATDGVPGYIVSRMAEQYGRPVSFVFNGAHDFQDGQDLHLDSAILRKSVNYKLLSRGLAYPTFYDGMFYDLRELFEKAAAKARKAGSGVWSKDTTNQYFRVGELSDITEERVILPKLFRRIVAYMKQKGGFDARDFLSSLEKESEKVLILSILHFTHFDNLLSVNSDGAIKLDYPPEDLVFLD